MVTESEILAAAFDPSVLRRRSLAEILEMQAAAATAARTHTEAAAQLGHALHVLHRYEMVRRDQSVKSRINKRRRK